MSPAPLYTGRFWWVTLVHVFWAVSILSMPTVQARWVLEVLGGTKVDVGRLFSAAIVGGLLLRPLAGEIMDRLGRRWAFAIGGLLATVGFPLHLPIESVGWALYSVRTLQGVGMGALFAVLFTYAADIAPADRRTEGLAVFGSVGLVALGLGPWLGEQLVAAGGYRLYYWAMGGVAALGLLTSLACPETRVRRPAGTVRNGWWSVVLDPRLRVVWVFGAIWGAVFGVVLAFIEPLRGARGLLSVSDFLMPYGASAVAMRLFGRTLPDRLGPARLLAPAVACQVVGTLLLATADSRLALGVAGALSGIGHGYAFPILSAMAVMRCSADDRGAAISVFTMVMDVGSLVCPPLAGAVALRWGFGPLFAICGGVLGLAVLLFVLWDRPYRRRGPDSVIIAQPAAVDAGPPDV